MFGKHANDLKIAKEHENGFDSTARAHQSTPSASHPTSHLTPPMFLTRLMPKRPLVIITLLALALSLGLNVHYALSNLNLSSKVATLTSELQASQQEASSNLKTLSDEHAKQISELTEKLSAANEVAQAAAIQAAKCLPLMKKYGVK